MKKHKRFFRVISGILLGSLLLAGCGGGGETVPTPTVAPTQSSKPTESLKPTAAPTEGALPTTEPTWVPENKEDEAVKLPVINESGMKYRLWYDEPAEDTYDAWEQKSLPVGNSSIGGNVFGRYDKEHITLNEKSFWTGGPSLNRPDYMGGNLTEAGNYGKTLAEVQRLFMEGKIYEGEQLCAKLVGTWDGYGGYQLFGNLYMDFGNVKPEEVSNYSRDLNVMTGVASVHYERNETQYKREIFTSYLENVMVIRLTAEGKDKLNFNLSLAPENTAPATRTTAIVAEGNTITYYGTLDDNQLQYSAFLTVQADGAGTVGSENGKSLVVSDACEVTILLSMGTDYKNVYPEYRSGETMKELQARVKACVDGAAAKSYEELYAYHVADVYEMMNRVDLNIGQTEATAPTDELLASYKKDTLPQSEKAYLETVLYQYGRYLLVSSSRGETLPANLQGIWVGKNDSAWSSDYHINVNLQMNYWHVYNTNLTECALPLIDYVEGLREPGRVTAEVYFGVVSDEAHPENGFTANTQTTPFGWTCPGWDFNWGWSPAAVPWIIQNVWEYYEYTLDETVLKEEIYPMMKEQTLFYQQTLKQDADGKWVSTPSYSPEHGPRTNGNTYEQTLVWQLFHDTILAAEIVGEDAAVIAQWQAILDNLKGPIEIGTSGQIKEWYEETSLGSIKSAENYNHRHLSHLLGLYPGDLISEDTPEWFDAAIVSMENRVDQSTGWAMGQRINTWARLGNGEKLYELITLLMKNGILDNLWDTHPPFQIDGNFGYTAGVTEALMQSNMGYINLLPALPNVWADGSVSGLVARGNFELSMQWQDKTLREATILSKSGGTCVVQFETGNSVTVKDSGGNAVAVTKVEDNRYSFETVQGEAYTISNELVLSAPKGFTAQRTSDTQAVLNWDTVEGAAGYVVYRSKNGAEYEKLLTVTGTTATDEDAGFALFSDIFTYKVAAADAAGKRSAFSYEKEISTEGTSRIAAASVELATKEKPALLDKLGGTFKLETTILPAEAECRNVWWKVTTKDGVLVEDVLEISADGLVKAVKPYSGTLVITAEAADGSGTKDSFELQVYTDEANLSGRNYFYGEAFTLEEGKLFSKSYGTEWLTDADREAERFAAKNTASNVTFEGNFDVTLTINTLIFYERVDMNNVARGDGSRFDSVEVQVKDGEDWVTVRTAETEKTVLNNNTVMHEMTFEALSADQLRIRLVHNGNGRGGITVWEMEAYHR